MSQVSPLQIALAAGAAVTVVAYVALILTPAWSSYGRTWERLAASFLTLFILASLIGVGAVVGLAVVWSYDRFV